MFNVRKVKDDLVQWIRDWFEKNGPECNAVVGISGGKDSTIVAALCVEALGADRVIGVTLPNKVQIDIDDSRKVIDYLGIRSLNIDMWTSYSDIIDRIIKSAYDNRKDFPEFSISNQTRVNLPPRLRMTTLYAIAQSVNGRVSNNCNLSEEYVGYSTRWGDSVGDFAPLANLTVSEVKAIGYELGLPEEFIEKTPSDGLCGKTDEDNLGFSYDVLDHYICTGECNDREAKEKIDYLHSKNVFKLRPIPAFEW